MRYNTYMNMNRIIRNGCRAGLIMLLAMITLNNLEAQQKALTIEEVLKFAETNSPAMKKTRLNLVRSQENLNAQNAAMKIGRAHV